MYILYHLIAFVLSVFLYLIIQVQLLNVSKWRVQAMAVGDQENMATADDDIFGSKVGRLKSLLLFRYNPKCTYSTLWTSFQ